MSQTLQQVRDLIESGEVLISAHGYDELAADDLTVNEVLSGVGEAQVVEDYPTYGKGPATLVFQQDLNGQPIHVVWGIPKGKAGPAVLVTAYRPDPQLWSDDFLRRK